MQVKQRLKINVIVMAVATAMILLVLSLSFYRLNITNNMARLSGDIIINSFERVNLRNDYLRNGNERAKAQWLTRHEHIGELLKLAEKKFAGFEDKRTIAEMLKVQASIGKLFSGIVANRVKSGMPGSDELSQETEDRLLSQLNMRVYEEISQVRKLLESSRKARSAALETMVLGIILVLVIMAAMAIFNSWSLGRAITDRIGRLHDGASVIGAGNLDHRIAMQGDDEFARLSEAFDTMTAKLRGSYHDLESQIEERQRAEEALREAHDALEAAVQERTQELKEAEQELRKMNESLEQLVAERTAALQAVNATLRDSRRAALNLTEDAIAARQRTEELNAELLREVVERRRAEEEREIAAGFLRLVNESKGIGDLVRSAVGYFREHSGCEAVGIRLKEGEDYPYFEVHGFPREFVQLENSICARDESGRPLYDGAGYPIMECMCGNVIQRRFDPEQPFFSAQGSFWTNSTTKLLATSTEGERQSRTRNRCNGEGYESVALVAIRSGAAPLGLLQLNDRRPDCFSPERIGLWERLAGYLGIALEKFQADEALHKANRRLAVLSETASALLAAERPQELVEQLCRKTMEHLDCQAFFNFLVDEEQGRLHLNACAGIDEDAIRKLEWLDYGVAVCGCAARDNCRIVAEHIPTTPDERTELVKSYGIKAYACHPLLGSGGKVIGTLSFGAKNRETFDDDDLSLMKAVADQVAVAMSRMATEQALLKRGGELQSANRELESFIYSVSHDLRTPIRSMAIFTNLIADSCADKLDERGKDYFRRVKEAGVRMNRLVEDLLYLSRVSRQEIKRTQFDLSEMAGQIIAELREASSGRNVEAEIEPGVDVFADPQLIKLVLTNLLGNAWKFTSRTDPARIALGAMAQEGQTAYYVRDNGAGFDPEYASKMFQPFQRLHSDNEFEGTGIGLAIVEQAIHRHGGKTWAEGDVGKGATVFFTLE